MCGARLHQEILDFIQEHEAKTGKEITALSLIGKNKLFSFAFDPLATISQRALSLYAPGYSAGGLFVRYAAGLFYEQGFFDRVQPLFLITLATPHLGVRDNPALRSGRTRNKVLGAISDFMCGRYVGAA